VKILITGGAGYVGSILTPLMLGEGYEVRVLDNLMYAQSSLLGCFWHPGFEFVRGDIRDESAVRAAVRDVDCIVHLAAIVGAPACRKNEALARDVNVVGTANVDRARSAAQPIVFASTGSNYGAVDGVCTEQTPLHPVSTYGRTKTEAERMLLDSGGVVAYRFATAFGLSPRLRLDLMVNDFAFQALKNGYILLYEKQFRRTFIHVRDMARAFVHAVEHLDSMTDEVYNVGNESLNYTKEQIALAIKARVDFHLYYADIGSDPDRRDYAVSYEKIRATGFGDPISLEDGIDELIAGYGMVSLHNPYSNIEQ
jgi:nucleoside-diphosphate-sugar epimerase